MLVSSMLKKWPITFILLGALCLPAQAEIDSPDCAQILQEVGATPTLNLSSYLQFLLENKIITNKNFESFYQSLQKNELINPIPSQKGDYGLTFSNSVTRSHFYRFQDYIENRDQLDFEVFKQLTKDELEKQGIKLTQKMEVTQAANYDFYLAAFTDHHLKDEISEQKLFEKDLHSIAPSTTQALVKELQASSDPKRQHLGNYIQAAKTERFDLALAQNALNDLNLQNVLHLYLVDDNSPEFTEFGIKIFDNFINNIKNKKRHHYLFSNLLEKIRNTKEEYKPYLKRFLQNPLLVTNNKTLVELLRLYENYKNNDDILFLKNLPKDNDDFRIDKVAISSLFAALLRMGEAKYVINFINNTKILYHTYDYEVIFKELELMSSESAFKIIKSGLQSSDYGVQKILAKKLSKINTPEALKFKKNYASIISTQRQTVLKLLMIAGLEEDWAIDFITKQFTGANNHIQSAALGAFKNGSSIKTRNIIEQAYKDYKNDTIKLYDVFASLEGRPVDDLLYFIKKYKNEEIAYACLDYLHGHSDPDAMGLSGDSFHSVQWLGHSVPYLKSLPFEQVLPTWRELAKQGQTSGVAIASLYGATDRESLAIMRNAINSTNEYIQQTAYYPYAYAYFYFLEKSQSSDLSEKKQAIEALNFLIK